VKEKGFLKSFNYAVGMFGTSIPINLLKTYAAVFYVDTLRPSLTTAQLALILLVYTFVDAVDNLVYGYLSDRTRSRWGRRRPWLVIGAPLLVLGLVAFYNPPALGGSLFAYCMLFYVFTGTIDSLINASYGALFPEMFRGDASRVVVNSMRQAFQLVAMIISIALTPVITGWLGFGLTSIIYGALGGGVILYMALTCRETDMGVEENRPKLWHSIVSIVKNFKFWMTGLANAFYSAAMSLVLVAMPFYVKYALKLGDLEKTILFAAVLLVAIGCVAVWAKLVKRFSAVPVWRAALITLGLSYIPLYFAGSLIPAAICSALVGFGFAGVIATMDLIGARIIDEDTQRYNVRREAIISNAMGFMNRLNGLFTSGAFLLVYTLYGFESGENPGPDPGGATRFLLTVAPPVLIAVAIVFSIFVRFPKGEAAQVKQGG
jgi:GPH family glycoside/pentoside/hexuronide:cation symporter